MISCYIQYKTQFQSPINKPKESRMSDNCLVNNKGHLKSKDLSTFRTNLEEPKILEWESSLFTFGQENKSVEIELDFKNKFFLVLNEDSQNSEFNVTICKKAESKAKSLKYSRFSLNRRKLSSTVLLADMLK